MGDFDDLVPFLGSIESTDHRVKSPSHHHSGCEQVKCKITTAIQQLNTQLECSGEVHPVDEMGKFVCQHSHAAFVGNRVVEQPLCLHIVSNQTQKEPLETVRLNHID